MHACQSRCWVTARAAQFFMMQRNFNSSKGREANLRRAGRISFTLARRKRESPTLRHAARFCGLCPTLARQLSSRSTASRTQCRRFSMPQWPTQWGKSVAAAAREDDRLVIA